MLHSASQYYASHHCGCPKDGSFLISTSGGENVLSPCGRQKCRVNWSRNCTRSRSDNSTLTVLSKARSMQVSKFNSPDSWREGNRM